LKERICKLADFALHDDLNPQATAVDYDPAYRELPEPVRIARSLRDYLINQTTIVREGDLLGGSLRFDGSIPTDIYHRAGHTHFDSFWGAHSDYLPENNPLCFLDWNHFCTDYPFIVRHGIGAYLPKIRQARNRHAGDLEKQDFYTGLEITCEAIHQWAGAIADAYAKKGLDAIAANCRKVPYSGADTFYEAVQSVFLAFLLMPDALGRLDQVLYPFYKRDIATGILDKETAYELIGELFVKVFSQTGGSLSRRGDRSGDNTLVVGGYTQEGTNGYNELSHMILEVVAELPTCRPQVSFRWTAETPFTTLREVVRLAKGCKCKNIVFTNDESRLKSFDKMGISHRDAVDYTMIGCNEWTFMGKGNTGSEGFFNPNKALETLLYTTGHHADAGNSYERFYRVYGDYLEKDVCRMMDLDDEYYQVAARDMNVLSSLFIAGCIEKGLPITRGGAKYNVSNWSVIGLSNLVDSLSVIRQFVYEEKRFTLAELSQMLAANWAGHESVRQHILRHGTFWGNDNGADAIMGDVLHTLDRFTQQRFPKKGGVYRFGCYTGYQAANISMGRMTRATPDGRFDGDPLAPALAPGVGKDSSGITAFLKSAGTIDYSLLAGATAVNLRLEKSMADSEEKMEKLTHLFDVYFRMGGIQLQPDYLSAAELIHAQQHPEDYRNLRVRVTGWSGQFTNFDRAMQDDIITRTEHHV